MTRDRPLSVLRAQRRADVAPARWAGHPLQHRRGLAEGVINIVILSTLLQHYYLDPPAVHEIGDMLGTGDHLLAGRTA